MKKTNYPKYIYFIGKGGVGKSTCSVATAMAIAEKGSKSLVISLDPAHNLSDIFAVPLEDKPIEIKKNLFAMEINLKKRLERALGETVQMMKNLYTYLNVINLESVFDTLKFSPGMEEYAVILALEEIHENYKDIDFIIFDTPPTGLTLRFFALPNLSLIWVEKLLALRKKILDKRDSLKNILGDKFHEKDLSSSTKSDSVYKELKNYEGRLRKIKCLLSSKDTFMSLLLNPDKLSFAEGRKILKAFETFSLPLGMTIVNKYGLYDEKIPDELSLFMDSFFVDAKKKFNSLNTLELPFKKSGSLNRDDMLAFGEDIFKCL